MTFESPLLPLMQSAEFDAKGGQRDFAAPCAKVRYANFPIFVG